MNLNSKLNRSWFALVTYSLLLFSGFCAQAAQSPSPVALLRGVEASRTEHDSFRARLEIRSSLLPPLREGQYEVLIEWDGPDRRRSEVVQRKGAPVVVIRDGNEFRIFQQDKHSDLELRGLHSEPEEGSGGGRGWAFDPRIVGLTDLVVSHESSVEPCLWYGDQEHETLKVVGRETINGVAVWRVRATRNDSTTDYWIEEPSFRVHKRTIQWPGTRVEINSEFDSADAKLPFPSRVVAKRIGNRSFEVVCIVNSFESGVDIPAERFTIKSLDLPIATPVVDYRISRIVGYWNSEGLSDSPAEARGGTVPLPAAAPEPRGHGRLILIIVNLIALAVIGLIWWYRRSAARQG